MKEFIKSDSKSKELHRLYKLGKCSSMDLLNYLASRYGFLNRCDFQMKMKCVVLSMIHLNQDYIPIKDSKTKYAKVKNLYNKYKDTQLKCACCGESHIELLTIDHVHNNGFEHKKVHRGHLFESLFVRGFKASDYQILCFNCNASLGFYGYCPHNPNVIRECNSKRTSRIRKELKEGHNVN